MKKYQDVTKYLITLPIVRGVINLRGDIIPLIDIGLHLYGVDTSISENSKVLVVSTKEKLMGLIVDYANDVIDVEEDKIQQVTLGNGVTSNIIHLGNRLIYLFDLEDFLEECRLLRTV